MDHSAQCFRRYLDGDESGFDDLLNELRGSITFFIQRIGFGSAVEPGIAEQGDIFIAPSISKAPGVLAFSCGRKNPRSGKNFLLHRVTLKI